MIWRAFANSAALSPAVRERKVTNVPDAVPAGGAECCWPCLVSARAPTVSATTTAATRIGTVQDPIRPGDRLDDRSGPAGRRNGGRTVASGRFRHTVSVNAAISRVSVSRLAGDPVIADLLVSSRAR
jgi:hypothetical protein